MEVEFSWAHMKDLVRSQQEVIKHQKEQIDNLSRAPSVASMQVERDPAVEKLIGGY